MGATVSIINEEMCRPLDGGDIQNDDSTVEVNDVRRLRELLHVVYKGIKVDDAIFLHWLYII